MMANRNIFILRQILICAALLVCSSVGSVYGGQHKSVPKKNELLTQTKSETREFFRKGDVFQAAFLVKLSDSENSPASKIDVRVLDVALGNAAPDVLQDRFTATLKERPIAGSFEVRVTAVPGFDVKPGTYKFTIGVRKKDSVQTAYQQLLSLNASRPQDPKIIVNLLSGDTIEMIAARDGTGEATFPVALSSQIDEPELKVIDVTFGARRIAGLRDSFKVNLKPRDADNPDRITVVKGKAVEHGPGTYILSVGLGVKGRPHSQTLTLKLTKPEATLHQLGTIRKTRRIWPFQDSSGDRTGPPLTLDLSNTVASLSKVEITQPETAKLDGEDVDSRIVSAPSQIKDQILPRQPRTLDTRLVGDFPPGNVSGSLWISAAELKQPMGVAYEVTTKWHKLMIVIILLAGLFAGYVMRSVLQSRVELNETKQQGFDLLTRMGKASQDHQDPKFSAELGEQITKLDQNINSGKPEDISAAIEAAKTKFKLLLDDLDKRLTTVTTAFAQFEDLVRTDWYVAESVNTILKRAGKSAAEIRRHIDNRNAQAAHERLDAVREDLDDAVRQAAVDWRKEIRDELERYDIRQRPPELVEVAKAVAAIRQDLTNLPVGAAKPDAGALLPHLHEISWRLGEFVRAIPRRLIGVHLDVVEVVKAAGGGENIESKLNETYDRVAEAADEVAEDSGRALAMMNRELGSLQDAVEKTLRDMAQTADTDTQQKVNDALEAANYKEAAEFLTGKLSASVPSLAGPQTVSGADQPPEFERASSALALAFSTMSAGKPTLVRTSQRVATLPADFEVRQAKSTSALMKAKFWQAAGFGILIGLAGYAIFQKDFVGTWPNVISVFLWAYALDLTSGALAGVVAKVPKVKA